VTTLILILVVLMVLVGLGVAYGVHHRRARAGGIIGIQRGTRSSGRSG